METGLGSPPQAQGNPKGGEEINRAQNSVWLKPEDKVSSTVYKWPPGVSRNSLSLDYQASAKKTLLCQPQVTSLDLGDAYSDSGP